MIPQVLRPPPYLSSTSLDELLVDMSDPNIPGAFLHVLLMHDMDYDALALQMVKVCLLWIFGIEQMVIVCWISPLSQIFTVMQIPSRVH